MFKGYTYTLNTAERNLAIATGFARTGRAKQAGLADTKQAEIQPRDFIDCNGAAGEIFMVAMLRDFGLFTEKEYTAALVKIREGGISSAHNDTDDGDVRWLDLNWDVKTTEHPDGGLWLTPAKRRSTLIDAYVLVTGDCLGNRSPEWEYTFHGTRTAAYILEWWYKKPDGRRRWRDQPYFNVDELNDMPWVVAMSQMPLDTGLERDMKRRLVIKANEEAYRRSDLIESPRLEADFVLSLGRVSHYWDQWLQDCLGYDEGWWPEIEPVGFPQEEDMLYRVIDAIADDLQEEYDTVWPSIPNSGTTVEEEEAIH